MPSYFIFENEGAKVLLCENHGKDDQHFLFHLPQQPKHLLSSSNADQLCQQQYW